MVSFVSLRPIIPMFFCQISFSSISWSVVLVIPLILCEAIIILDDSKSFAVEEKSCSDFASLISSQSRDIDRTRFSVVKLGVGDCVVLFRSTVVLLG